MSDIKKVRDYQKSRQPKPPISKAEHRANCEIVVNSLMPIIEKMMKSPNDIQPVAESFDDLLFEMRNGIKKQPYIMQAGGRRLAVCDDVVTELEYQPADDTKKSTFIDTGNDTKIVTSNYSKDELKILETLK